MDELQHASRFKVLEQLVYQQDRNRAGPKLAQDRVTILHMTCTTVAAAEAPGAVVLTKQEK